MKKKIKMLLFGIDQKDKQGIARSLGNSANLISIKKIEDLVDHLQKNKGDILLVDYKSVGNNSDQLHRIGSRHSIPIILLTDSITEKVLAISLQLGIKSYVRKKNIKELPELIKPLIDPTKNKGIQISSKYRKTKGAHSLNSDELLRIVTNKFPKSAIAIVNKDLKIQYTGGEEYTSNNLNPESYTGKSVQQALKPYGPKVIKTVIDAYKKTFKGQEQTFQINLKDQTFLYKTKPLISDDKKIYSLLVVAENITLQLAIENSLKKAEENYRTTLSRITDGFVALDTNWRYTYMNKKAAKIFAINPVEIIGKHVCYAFDERDAKTFQEAYKKSMKEQKYKFVEEYYAPLGKWFENHIYPSPTGLSIYFRDITERKKTEEKLKELNKKADEAIRIGKIGFWEWDIVKDEVYWSDRMYEIYDLKNDGLLNYKKVISCIHPEDRTFHDEIVERHIKSKKKICFKYRLIRKDKSVRYVEVNMEVISNAKGKTIKLQGTAIDSTDRINTENKLIKSEAKYRTLVEQASDAIFTVNDEGKLESFNSTTCRLSGYSAKEIRGMTIYDFIYPKDLEAEPFRFDELFAGKTVTTERRVKRKNNTPIYGEITAKVFEGNKILVFAKDITERRKFQSEILSSKIQFQNLIENISGVYWVNDLINLKTLYVSPSYETVWGRKCELLYKNPADFLKAVHPDDKIMLHEAYQNISKTLSTNISYRIVRPDGKIRWIKAKTNVVKDPNGKALEYGYAEDITDAKKAELENQILLLRNKQVISTMFDGFFLIDDHGNFIEVNPSYCQTMGYTEAELLKMNINDLKVERSIANTQKRFAETQRKKQIQFETKHVKKDGTIVEFSVSSSIMIFDDKPLLSSFVKDITEQNKSQRRITEYTEQLRQLTTHLQNIREEERASLSRELHDEIGQQLMAIKIDVSRLEGLTVKNDKSEKLFADIKTLIDESVSTIRRINSELRPSLLDDMGLFAALEYQVKELTRRTNIKFNFDICMDEPKLGDKTSIGVFRIFQESLTNIVKHAEADTVTAHLSQSSGKMELTINDNGKGFEISEGTINNSFGLMGMRERASMMDGTLEVISKSGSGTTLSLVVPIN